MSVFNEKSFDHHELVVFKEDVNTGLKAIIAVHNTNLGASLGGCRMYPYADDRAALEDVLRLSRGMTYKSALAGLPLGGGKSVIIGDPHTQKSRDLLLSMGEFVDSLGGRYIVAEDSGTCVEDIEVIGEKTKHISGVQRHRQHGGDPSPTTAYGVYRGIEAAVAHRFGPERGCQGLKVAIQGAGNVGRHLAEHLIANGASVYVADVSQCNLNQAQALGAKVVGVDEILTLDVDVFAPCAMGAVINDHSISAIRAAVIAGAANNQLARPEHAQQLDKRGILYAPDFVINAGGIIDAYYQQVGVDEQRMISHVDTIATTLGAVFEQAAQERKTTHQVAEDLAEKIFQSANRAAA